MADIHDRFKFGRKRRKDVIVRAGRMIKEVSSTSPGKRALPTSAYRRFTLQQEQQPRRANFQEHFDF
jgi:hypothetical protein